MILRPPTAIIFPSKQRVDLRDRSPTFARDDDTVVWLSSLIGEKPDL